MRRGKRHDFFTSCLPWPQKGDAVTLPLGSIAPVIGNGKTLGFTNGTQTGGLFGSSNDPNNYLFRTGSEGTNVGSATSTGNMNTNVTFGVSTNAAYSGLIADLTHATSATVNAIRQAFQGQVFLELDARGGTRYTEIVRSHFGVERIIFSFRLLSNLALS